jgi:LDH2 family malate/lactate/ureidoglycolate dehydrogenase
MVALLSGPLVGADVGRAQLGWLSGRPDPGGSKGHLFIAIDPSCFTTPEAFREAATAYLDDIKSSRRPEGAGPIRIPGERALAEQRTSLAEGVVVLDAVWQRAIAAAAERGVAVPEAPLL